MGLPPLPPQEAAEFDGAKELNFSDCRVWKWERGTQTPAGTPTANERSAANIPPSAQPLRAAVIETDTVSGRDNMSRGKNEPPPTLRRRLLTVIVLKHSTKQTGNRTAAALQGGGLRWAPRMCQDQLFQVFFSHWRTLLSGWNSFEIRHPCVILAASSGNTGHKRKE